MKNWLGLNAHMCIKEILFWHMLILLIGLLYTELITLSC